MKLMDASVKVGDRFPDFELRDHQSRAWALSAALGHGPAVLVFYRGDW